MPQQTLSSLLAHEDLVFFRRDPPFDAVAEPPAAGFALRCFDRVDGIPPGILAAVVGNPLRSVLCWRMRRGEARLVVLLDDENAVAAYGWMQGWRPFQRVFAGIAQRPIMIGPAFTAPAFRGRGHHATVLKARLSLMPPDMTALTFAERSNIASIKGIEGVGFRQTAEVRLTRVLRVLRHGVVQTVAASA